MFSTLTRHLAFAMLCLAGLARPAAAESTLIMYCGVDENWCRAMTTE